MTPLLRLEAVRKSFGAVPVLGGIDLEVPPHGVTALIGASGSGKSTLLRCLNLLEHVEDVLALDERHLVVELPELELPPPR